MTERALPQPFTAIAASLDPYESAIVVAIQHDAVGDAQTNADALDQRLRTQDSAISGEPFSDWLEDWTIDTDGAIVVLAADVGEGGLDQLLGELFVSESLFGHR